MNTLQHRAAVRRHQRGAVIVTAALVLLFLLGFMGIALDFGHLFVVKTELQTAMDSCALSAAQELDGTSLARAQNAGVAAGNRNGVNMQSGSGANGTWSGQSKLVAADVTFRDAAFNPTTLPAQARYAECNHTQPAITVYLLKMMAAVTGNTANNPTTRSVAARAVATRASAQTTCVVPVGVCKKADAAPWGFTPGDWLKGVINDKDDVESSGDFHWVDFDGNGGGARDIKDMLANQGSCNIPTTNPIITDDIGKNGKTNGAVDAWNTRFGIYKGSYNQTANPPDATGYAWYESSDVVPNSMKNRYGDATASGFKAKRASNAPYEGDNNNPDTKQLNAEQGSGSSGSTNYAAGGNRRIVTAPVVDCSNMQLKGFACLLMLHPLEKNASGKKSKMWMEFIGNASNPSSSNPCATPGLAGGAAGAPLVPVLVR